MKYKLLGKSGLRVSELCLGTMTFGEDWEWGSNYETSRKIFDTFEEAGGNFIDTANIYTNGTSEKLVGEFIRGNRDKWVIATKYTLNNQSKNVNEAGNHRKNMVQSLEGSLQRLKVDYIDLFWLHAWDFTTPISEVMRALDDLVRAGKVLYIGISDAPAWVVSSSNTLAELRGLSSFIALQIEYSLIERTPERELLPMAKAFDLAVTPWSPLAGGLLTGKYNQKQQDQDSRLAMMNKKLQERELKIAEKVTEIANKIGKTPSQVALNWILQQSPQMFPIIGARKTSHLKDNLGCLDFSLSEEHKKELTNISQISLGFPHDFFDSEIVQDFAFNGLLRKIEYPEQRKLSLSKAALLS